MMNMEYYGIRPFGVAEGANIGFGGESGAFLPPAPLVLPLDLGREAAAELQSKTHRNGQTMANSRSSRLSVRSNAAMWGFYKCQISTIQPSGASIVPI